MEYVGFKKVGNFPDVVGFQFLSVYIWVEIKVNVEEVFGAVVLVHAYILELKVDDDVVVGQEGGKLDELVSEILDELVIYVGNPGLEFDGDVFEQKMDAVLLLQHWFDSYHLLIFEFA